MRKFTLAFILFLYPLYAAAENAEDIQKIALSDNPRIKAMGAEVIMMKSRLGQSNALDDPRLKFAVNNLPAGSFSFTKEDMTSKEIGLSQMIPLGKLGYRKSIAEKEYERALARLSADKVETLYMLRMYIYEAAYAGEALRILDEIRAQVKLVIDSETASSKSVTGSLSNVIKARIEYDMIDEEIITLRQALAEAGNKINYYVGRPVTQESNNTPEFRDIDPEAVKREILSSNPELMMLRYDMDINRDEISLKKSEYIPDMEIGISYMQRDNAPGGMKRDDMISGMVSFNIPFWFWKKNRNMVSEMGHKDSSVRSIYQDRINDMNARAEILCSRLTKWRDIYTLYSGKLMPQSELGLDISLSRYRTGSAEFMTVIDNVRLLLRNRKELAMAVREYRSSYSELMALTGREVLP